MFHQKFGNRDVMAVDGNKLTIAYHFINTLGMKLAGIAFVIGSTFA